MKNKYLNFIIILTTFSCYLKLFSNEKNALNLFAKIEDSELKIESQNELKIDYGTIKSDKKLTETIKIDNQTEKPLEFMYLRSPCSCIIIKNKPDKIEAGKAVEIKMELDGKDYLGKFKKFMPIILTTKNTEKTIFIEIKFNVINKDLKQIPNKPEIHRFMINYVDYDNNKNKDVKYKNASTWIFAAKGCPGCNLIKKTLLPILFENHGISVDGKHNRPNVVFVNLNIEENFAYFLDKEDELKGRKKDPPILLWKNKLYYGVDEVKKLVEASKKDIKTN